MIPPLPVELVSHILDLATSPSHAVSVRKQDRHFLRQCCLVSRLLCAVAQPKLWKVCSVEGGKTLTSILSSFPLLADHIRILTLDEFNNRGNDSSAPLEALPNLIEVRVDDKERITLEQAASMRYLEHLHLAVTNMPDCASVTFTNLVSLTLKSVWPCFKSTNTIFPAASFPVLRALYVRSSYYKNGQGRMVFLEPHNLPRGQLDCYQVHIGNIGVLPADIQQRGTPLLLTFAPHESSMSMRAECAAFAHFQMNSSLHNDGLGSGTSSALLNLVQHHQVIQSLSLSISLSPSCTNSSRPRSR